MQLLLSSASFFIFLVYIDKALKFLFLQKY